MRSLSANQRELSKEEYNAYKFSSKVNFENLVLSKSPICYTKIKEKVKYKVENRGYTDILKHKENYSKSTNNNNNIIFIKLIISIIIIIL